MRIRTSFRRPLQVGSQQSGVALLTAIFVVALATIAATALATSSAIALRRAENLQSAEIARWYAEGVESWVKSVLALDAKAKSGKSSPDALGDAWAQPVSFIPIDNGGIRGQVVDLQGLFNLNSLATTNQNDYKRNLQIFESLLENIPNFDPNGASGLGDAIRDWVDADDQRSGSGGAEDGDYLGLDPPYLAANQPVQSVSELLAIHGMTPKIFAALRPYVCALPTTSLQINVNTAPGPVLMALVAGGGGNAGEVESFVKERLEHPAEKISDLPANMLPKTANSVAQVNSTYFELRQEVVVGSVRVALYSVIYRPSGGSSPPIVIAHSTDTD
jgi:general secretion pathway protein K